METKLNWEFIKAQLPAGWRELAIERRLIRPQPPQLHAKVTDIEQVLRLVLQPRPVALHARPPWLERSLQSMPLNIAAPRRNGGR